MRSYSHQSAWLNDNYHRPHAALFWEMGLGKSRVIIENIHRLNVERKVGRVLITTNKSWYLNWLDEIRKHWPRESQPQVLVYSASLNDKKRGMLFRKLFEKDGSLKILLANIELFSLNSHKLREVQQFIDEFQKYLMVVVDESTCIKSPTAKRTKNVLTLCRPAAYKRILTGTPVTQSPLDLYSQAEFLNPGLLGFSSFTVFKSYYAIEQTMVLGTRYFKKVSGYRNLDKLVDSVRPWASALKKEDCLDLPEKIFVDYTVDLTAPQKRMMDQLKQLALVQLKSGAISTSQSALTTAMRLYQIVTGFIHDDEGNVHTLDSTRINEMFNLYDEQFPGKKVIIWAKFVKNVEDIVAVATERYGQGSAVAYMGKVKQEDRPEMIRQFREGDAKFFVGNEAAAKSLTLVEAHTNFYYSVDYKLETWLQSQDRTHRIGQNQPVTYVCFKTPGTIETNIYRALLDKKNLADTIVNELKALVQE